MLGMILAFSTNYAFATDPYETQSNRFIAKPTVCVVEPSDNLSTKDTKSVMDEAKKSVYDWIIPLHEKSNNPNKWAINYLEIPANKSFDLSSCNVIINFKNEMNAKVLPNLGTHKYMDRISYITIFYKTNQCVQSMMSCKTNNDSLIAQIGATLRHEFGHAIGLGHYTSDKSKNKEWFENPNTAPSIMLAYSKGLENEHVTSGDINKVIEIYGNSGFVNRHLPNPRQTLPVVLTQIIPTDLFISDHYVRLSKETNTIQISGTFEKMNKPESVIITIVRPDFEIEKIKTVLDRDGNFEYDFKVHTKMPKGLYYVQAQYNKNLTQKNLFELS
jgi:hypothetical protein